MKILYTATVLSHICQFHLPHMQHLQEQGWEVHVAAHDNLAVKNGLQLRYCDKFIETPFSRSPKSRDTTTPRPQIILRSGTAAVWRRFSGNGTCPM